MKKVFVSIILALLFVVTGCKGKELSNNKIETVTKYISSLDSYELKGNMTIHRDSKDVNILVTVSYLNPNYYKVSFVNPNNTEQLIVKNDDGVFVLTPSLNKEFKFDSEWPLNSSHAYLLSGIINDIKADSSSTFELDNDVVIISSKLSNKSNTATKLKFYFNEANKMPKKAILLDDNDNEKVIMEFTDFSANKSINKDQFNTKLIMEEKGSVNESTESSSIEEASITVTAGYVCDGSVLETSIVNGSSTVLCYTGEKEYTIVVNKSSVYPVNVITDEYLKFDFIESGLLLIGANLARFFINDLELSIYANNLSTEDVLAIASDISII